MPLRFVAAVAACLFATGVQAQGVPCLVGPPSLLATLLARTGEVPLIQMQLGGTGPETPSSPGLLTVAPDGQFSLLLQAPNGSICIIAGGFAAEPATGDGFPKPIIPGKDS